jgi:RNA polymerase sigma factor (sigma-70 family)
MDRAEKSKQFAMEMAAGNFENIVGAFDATMTSMLSKEQLEQVWLQTVGVFGAFSHICSTESKQAQDVITLEYENCGLKVTLKYDTSGKINGLWLNPVYIQKPNEDLIPNAWELQELEEFGSLDINGFEALAASLSATDPARVYLKEIAKFKPLAPEEEAVLAENAVKGDREARKRLIESSLGHVVGVAKRYTGSGMALMELIQEGNLGLVQAIANYDAKKGITFAAYAAWWIRKSVKKTAAMRTQTEQIKIGGDSALLDGLLLIPEAVGSPPVVIMIQGSGQHDYDETIGANKPFRDIAEGLAQQGIASIQYHKRYYQYPETAPPNITVEDEVTNDAGWAVQYPKSREELRNSRIYILGHSLGGMLAPYIARVYPEVAGIISMAGSPRKLEDIMLDQQTAILQALKDKTETEKASIAEALRSHVDRIKSLEQDTQEAILGIPASYWASLNKLDIAGTSKDLSIPMLIQQGSADFQVYADIDYILWQDILKGKSNVTFKLYDNLNHLFMPTLGKRDAGDYALRSAVSERVIYDIADWINGLL